MRRSLFAALLFNLGVLALPQSASALDVFSTEKRVETGPFAQFHAAACPKDRIQSPLTLADVVDLSLCNNPRTRSLWAASRAQAAQLGVSMSAYLPTLSSPVNYSRSDGVNNDGSPRATGQTLSVGLTLSYLLFDFGGRSASVENAKQLLVAANASRDASLQDIYYNAVLSYYNVLSSRASVDAARAAETSAQKSLDAAETRYQVGTGTPAERLQARTALSQATLDRIRAAGVAASAQGTLANVMGFDAAQSFTLAPAADTAPDEAAERDIGRMINDARQSRPDLQAAEAQIKAAEANVTAVRSNALPSVNLNGSMARNRFRDGGLDTSSTSNSVGVSITFPWFRGFGDVYRIRAAQAQLEQRVAERDLMANQIALDVWNTYQTLLTNSQALRAANDLLASAEQSEKVALGRYQAGVGSILDVLTAQSALASARQQRISALYTFQSSRFALAQAMGQLDLTLVGN
ncbi:MAG: TolC family protein [Gallionellaceae bacterium]|jgi:TolC family type I secretion outer membrane protein|nr:TolC family protein [Gallionellaceae bacterium]